jgi:hypothetical protein
MPISADEQQALLAMGEESRRQGVPASDNPFFKRLPDTDGQHDVWLARLSAWAHGWAFEDARLIS